MALNNLGPNDFFFEKILRQGLQDETIQNVVLLNKELATKTGENYLSILTRFTLRYVCGVSRGNSRDEVEKTAHLILKEEPDVSEETLENIREMDVFNVERQLLEEIVPKVEALVGRRLGAKVYYSSIEPQIIVMEDLAFLGFKNTDRRLGMNREQTLLIMESLAAFHAGSILLDEQNPGCLKRFTKGLLNPNLPPTYYKTIESTVKSVAKQIRSWPGTIFGPISKKLEEISKDVIRRLKQTYEYDDDELCVLNHGDLWANNIMFRNDDDGKPRELRLVDFQLSIWSSPAVDLTYFLGSAPEFSIKGTQDDIVVKKYLTCLSQTMEKIGCTSTAPTMEQLKKSLHKRRIMLLVSGLFFFPKMIAEEGEVESMEDILQKETDDIDIMKNPRVKEVLAKMLPIWNERGFLD